MVKRGALAKFQFSCRHRLNEGLFHLPSSITINIILPSETEAKICFTSIAYMHII